MNITALQYNVRLMNLYCEVYRLLFIWFLYYFIFFADADSFYNKAIAMEDLISYSFQVARGMEFLASRKVRVRTVEK